MLRKFIDLVKSKKAFSIVEVIVAIFIASITIFSVVEIYRYVFFSSSRSKEFERMILSVKKVYNAILLGEIEFNGYLSTNVDGVDIVVKQTNTLGDSSFGRDIAIFATNKSLRFSVITSLY